jgi:nitrogen fixation NifU-like protein
MTYSEQFKDHLSNPRNAGELQNATHKSEETNPVCGDRVCLSLRVEDEKIIEVKFLAYGCPPTLVCASVLTELIEGSQIEDALKLTKQDITSAIGGLPSRKQHAASLAIETLQTALR